MTTSRQTRQNAPGTRFVSGRESSADRVERRITGRLCVSELVAKHPTADVLELFLERAAIREYDGGFPRPVAERLALEDVESWLGDTKS